ncbi:MAG: SAM-dependent methyltransferase [Betaproteobacteria bacterium RIFCSPLOWO2_12_FULL_67_28]|nr:MAG: SAM-dependent methyltransferase [Betaproteobacteria bacterium RIFCSPLOWO2_12_FULL_67_28]
MAHAETVLTQLLAFAGPADQTLSAYFRKHRQLGQRDRAFVAEAAYAVLRRRRTLEAAAGSSAPRLLLLAALVRQFGLSGRALGLESEFIARLRSVDAAALAPAVQADLPDWLWARLAEQQGGEEAVRIARGLFETAPLDLRVNLARLSRDDALAQLGLEARATPLSPAGIRLTGKPAINRHALFLDGSIEVQDEGSQLLAYLVAPRRGEMVADFCAGAGGKTLALAMLMRGAGRLYAMDVSAKRLAALAPRAARAGASNIHPLVLSGENDLRARRLAGKLDRVLVDAPCSGFGTLRRNPDLKWRYGPERIAALAGEQLRILAAASRLVKAGGRLVYATCSILREENEAVTERFLRAAPGFEALSCAEILAQQRIALDTGSELRLWPHRHATDGFFAAAFVKR